MVGVSFHIADVVDRQQHMQHVAMLHTNDGRAQDKHGEAQTLTITPNVDAQQIRP